VSVALWLAPPPTGTYVTLTQHDSFAPMLFPVQRSDEIQNVGEPVKRIANLPELVELELPSLNPFVTRRPPSTAPNS